MSEAPLYTLDAGKGAEASMAGAGDGRHGRTEGPTTLGEPCEPDDWGLLGDCSFWKRRADRAGSSGRPRSEMSGSLSWRSTECSREGNNHGRVRGLLNPKPWVQRRALPGRRWWMARRKAAGMTEAGRRRVWGGVLNPEPETLDAGDGAAVTEVAAGEGKKEGGRKDGGKKAARFWDFVVGVGL